MNKEQIVEQLYEWIRDRFEIGDDPEYTTDAHLFDYGFVDSLDATEILAHIEDEYEIEVTQKDLVLYPMNTVDEIAEVIASKVA